MLALCYPDHLGRVGPPGTRNDLALRLARDMDVAWFANSPDFEHSAVSDFYEVRDPTDGEQALAFDFGPYDPSADEFITSDMIILRDTAGGGIMLLVQNSAGERMEKISSPLENIVGRDAIAGG